MPSLAGEQALLSVHDRPDAPVHDTLLRRGNDQRWRVSLDEWSRWTPLPPPALEVRADGSQVVPLQASDRFAFRIDGCTSELWVDADPTRVQTLKSFNRPSATPPTTAGYGGFLNVDAEYGGLAGREAYSSLLDLGAFAPLGAGRSTAFVNQAGARRLDSDWIHDDPDRALRLRLGDSITDSAEWESAVRFGGLQWGTDFALQPDRITFPLPSIKGSAALASTAQLYMNGQQLSQQALQPGQFRFDSVPVLNGAGELSVVVRDALGREQTVTQPFYASPRLLAAGLNAFTFESGFLRENYASPGDRYTEPFAAGKWQRGLSNDFTALLRGVAGDRRQSAGGETDWIAGNFGVLSLSAAAAHTEAGWGGVATAGFERTAERLSVSLRRRFATAAYGDLGRAPGTLHFSDAARLSYNLVAAGTASLVYISEQPWRASGTRLAGLAYSLQPMRGVQAYASWLHPLASSGGDSLVVGLSINLGRGSSGGLQWNRDGGVSGERAFLQHSPAGPLGWSYSGTADASDDGLRQAQAAWASARGTLGFGYAALGGHGAPSAVAQTGIALLDGHPYWTREVQNSFAVVDVGQTPGVRVYRENQLVGRTGAQGRLLVPDLLPFQGNHLSIDDRDLPIALGLSDAARVVAPPANAGVPVHFAVDAQKSTRLRLLDMNGSPLPVGAALSVDGRPLPLPVGYDGLVYAALTQGTHMLEAKWPTGACRVQVAIARSQPTQLRCLSAP